MSSSLIPAPCRSANGGTAVKQARSHCRTGKAELGMLILLSQPRCHIPKRSPSPSRGVQVQGVSLSPPLMFPSCKTQRCSGKGPNQAGFLGTGYTFLTLLYPKVATLPRFRWGHRAGKGHSLRHRWSLAVPFPTPRSFSISITGSTGRAPAAASTPRPAHGGFSLGEEGTPPPSGQSQGAAGDVLAPGGAGQCCATPPALPRGGAEHPAPGSTPGTATGGRGWERGGVS